jgi:hypothetical protein
VVRVDYYTAGLVSRDIPRHQNHIFDVAEDTVQEGVQETHAHFELGPFLGRSEKLYFVYVDISQLPTFISAVKFAAVVKFKDQVMKDFKFSVHGMLYLSGDVEGD